MKNIAFLFDKTNDWLSQYFPEALRASQRFDVRIFCEEVKRLVKLEIIADK